jgi:hypothetical protein
VVSWYWHVIGDSLPQGSLTVLERAFQFVRVEAGLIAESAGSTEGAALRRRWRAEVEFRAIRSAQAASGLNAQHRDSRRPNDAPCTPEEADATAVPPLYSHWRLQRPESFRARIVPFPMYAGVMHEFHRNAAEYHELAAKAHRTAAEHNEKGDDETANWHSQRALEYSNRAYELAKEAHNKSGRIETLP